MVKDAKAVANRIRAAAGSLTDPHDIRVVSEYLTELEVIAAQQEEEEMRPLPTSITGSSARQLPSR